MGSASSPVRLKVLDKGTAPEAAAAFSAGQADLAVVRADTRNIPEARTVVLVTHAVTLLIALPGSWIDDINDLKGKTVGVVGSAVNQHVVAAISKEYDLERAKVRFRDIPLHELSQAIKGRQMQALLVVTPISEKYLALLRSLWPRGAKFSLVAIEAAGAIAAVNPSYDSYDLPKGTIRGSPAISQRRSDDAARSHVSRCQQEGQRRHRLGADQGGDGQPAGIDGQVPDAVADCFAQHRQKPGFIPIHAGAAAYFDGDQKTFFDKYGDQIFYGSMLLGTLTSIFAAAWKFMTKNSDDPAEHPLRRLHGLIDQISKAGSDTELDAVERSIDDVLKAAARETGRR